MDVHAKNPKFQSWLKSSGHGAGQSVKQASKEVKSSERVKQLQAKSLKAYGATKGTRMGSADGSGEELKDTIKPLTRDQHSKVQAAARAAKKTPLTKDQRMAAIAASVRKYKEKHDVPTVDPDDEGHDDLRDIHQSLHIRKGYNEEVEQVDETRRMSAAEKLARAFDRARAESEASRRRGKELLQSRATKEMPKKETVAEAATIASDKEVKMAKGIAFDKRYKGGNMTGASNAIEKIRPGLSKHPKVAAALRSANEEREMSYGKKIAKIMLAKQSKHPIAQNMGEAVKDQADVGEYDYEGDMAKSQLRSILTNAKRLHDMLEDTTNLPEWVQSKITLAEDYILTAANYMEGEMNEEVEQVDEKIDLEKAKMGDVIKDFYKSKAPQFKGKSMEKRREMAIAAKLGAERGMKEEVEQMDEVNARNSFVATQQALTPRAKDVKASVGTTRRDAAVTNKYARRISKLSGGDYSKQDVKGNLKSLAKEEAEQVEEKYENNPLIPPRPNKAVGLKPSQLAKKPVTAEGADDWKKAFAKVAKRNLNQDTAQVKQKVKKLEPVDEAEGSVPTTPKEKELAAHHGDPKKITYGDVIKARLKSAAAKKMGK
jgi:hypothetical protein